MSQCLQIRRSASKCRWLSYGLFLGILLCISGCTNSKLLISPLYNRLDNQIRKEFNKLGEFNEQQTQAFEKAVGTFHVWHRQSELPKYASLLSEIAQSITQTEQTQPEEVERWATTAEQLIGSAQRCYPANFLVPVMQSLNDKQINFIQRRFKNERQLNKRRYRERTAAQRVAFRLDKMETWASRLYLDFTDEQRSMLRDSLQKHRSLHSEYYNLVYRWDRDWFNLARHQQTADYEAKMTAQLASLWSMLQTNYPTHWQNNRTLWKNTAYEFITSMSDTQRKKTSRWLKKMGKTLLALSTIEPSFNVKPDPSIGCLVGSSLPGKPTRSSISTNPDVG